MGTRIRGAVALVVAFVAVGLVVGGVALAHDVWQSIVITLGCQLVLFLPLLLIERTLTNRTDVIGRQVERVQQAVERAQLDQWRGRQMSQGALDVAEAAGAKVGPFEEYIRQVARDADVTDSDPSNVVRLLREARKAKLITPKGVMAPVRRVARRDERRWYLIIVTGESDLRFSLYEGDQRQAGADWTAEIPASSAISALIMSASRRTGLKRAPGPMEIADALDEIVEVIASAWLAAKERSKPVRGIMATVGRADWALTDSGLAALQSSKRFKWSTLLHWRLMVGAVLRGAPLSVVLDARATLTSGPNVPVFLTGSTRWLRGGRSWWRR